MGIPSVLCFFFGCEGEVLIPDLKLNQKKESLYETIVLEKDSVRINEVHRITNTVVTTFRSTLLRF